MTPEGKVKKRMTEGLDQLGAYWFFPATHGYGRSGVSDIVACIDGLFFAFECKAEGNDPTALQIAEQRKVHEAKGYAWFVIGEKGAEKTLLAVEAIIGRKRGGQKADNRRSKTGPRLRAE